MTHSFYTTTAAAVTQPSLQDRFAGFAGQNEDRPSFGLPDRARGSWLAGAESRPQGKSAKRRVSKIQERNSTYLATVSRCKLPGTKRHFELYGMLMFLLQQVKPGTPLQKRRVPGFVVSGRLRQACFVCRVSGILNPCGTSQTVFFYARTSAGARHVHEAVCGLAKNSFRCL